METVEQDEYRSVALLLHDFLGYTSMHGAGRIVASRHRIRKTFWVISILACLALVSWQVHDLHVIYRKRPLATHVHIAHNTVSNISNTKDRVWSHFQTPRRELKIRCAAEYFWRASRCLEIWSNTAVSVWYDFSTEAETMEKTEKQNLQNLCRIKIRYPNTVTVMSSFV